MNLPLQREPVERSVSCQAMGEKDPATTMLAAGLNPSEHGIQPNDWKDIVGGIAKTLPSILSLF